MFLNKWARGQWYVSIIVETILDRDLIIVRSFCYDNGYLAFTLYCWADIVRCAPLPLSRSTIRIRGIQLEDNASSAASCAARTRACLSLSFSLFLFLSRKVHVMRMEMRHVSPTRRRITKMGCRLRRLLNYKIRLAIDFKKIWFLLCITTENWNEICDWKRNSNIAILMSSSLIMT